VSVLVDQVQTFCQRHNLLTQDDHVVVGVSGGPDSLCLLHILNTLKTKLNLHLTVAHLNHQLRGTNAIADADFVQQLALAWDLPIIIDTIDVTQKATQAKQSLEEAARQARYHFFAQVATQVRADKVAVGHQAEDQTETVLMHLLRGSGLHGLRGIQPTVLLKQLGQPSSPDGLLLIRPLLEVTRAEILAYCQHYQLNAQVDESNQDTNFFRNRLRHELIPYLESYNPNIRQLLRQTAKIITAEVDLLELYRDECWQALVVGETAQSIEFDLSIWLRLPIALQRAMLRRAMFKLVHHLRNISFEHIETAITIIATRRQTGVRATLPQDIEVTIRYNKLIITPITNELLDTTVPYMPQAQPLNLAVPGITLIPQTPWQITITVLLAKQIPQHLNQTSPWEGYFDADVMGDTLMLRTRLPGDRFCPLGLHGQHQKLKDFLINVKIPADQRDYIPLLVAHNQIMWVCGYRLANMPAIKETTHQIYHIKFEPVHKDGIE